MTALLHPKDAAEFLCITEKQLRLLTVSGRIRYVNVGLGEQRDTRRYDIADLEDFKLVMTGNWPEPDPIPEWSGPSSPVFPRLPVPADSRTGYVYFIAAGGRVKIGRAKSIKARMNALASGCPYALHLVHYEPGGVHLEQKYHSKFAAYRDRLEWFRIEGKLEEFLKVQRP